MTTWSKFAIPKGVYISPPFPISSSLDRYFADIKSTTLNPHDQKINYFYRVSYDSSDWSDWEEFIISPSFLLGDKPINNLYIQIKIIVNSEHNDKNPIIQELRIDFESLFIVNSMGDLPIKPKIWVTKRNGDGDISLLNKITGQNFELKNLKNGEEVYIDCENEEIVSSHQHLGVYRYDSHNDEYIELVGSENHFVSKGDFDMDIRYKAKLLQE